MNYYKNVDFTFKTYSQNKLFLTDVLNMYYYKHIWDEYELVFIKGNRQLNIPLPNNIKYIFNKIKMLTTKR
jgi:TRAP-type mannitol/chloroaromatic compound transport system substrate-binding protein